MSAIKQTAGRDAREFHHRRVYEYFVVRRALKLLCCNTSSRTLAASIAGGADTRLGAEVTGGSLIRRAG